jgi:hypothetical protein
MILFITIAVGTSNPDKELIRPSMKEAETDVLKSVTKETSIVGIV